MSAAPKSGAVPTTKAVVSDESKASAKPAAAQLEEDDEFEDFPVENWTQEENEAPAEGLWEESWDDDDTSEDFSAQLKEELKKVEASKKR